MEHTEPGDYQFHRWYIVHCRSRCETFVAKILTDYTGITTFYPEIIAHTQEKPERVALFPGYIFVQMNLREVQMSRLNSTPGVIRCLEFGNGPEAVPDIVVETIREHLYKMNTNSGKQSFLPGEQVHIKTGPLRGMKALFVDTTTPQGRVRVLLHFLGRLREIKVEQGVLEKTPIPKRPRERYTRGKGRKINRNDLKEPIT